MFALQGQILDEFRRAAQDSRRRAQRDADTRLLGTVGLDGPEESGPSR
jgi:hypothetical protein